MYRCFLLLFLLFGAMIGPSLFAFEQPEATNVARLIEQMGSSDFATRQKACQQLRAIGEPALRALRKAASDNADVEVRKQAAEIASVIQQRLDAVRILTPRRLHLVYKDMPLEEALADFKKKSGCNLVLKDAKKSLAGRRLTLDTGEVTFWEAFDRFCAKAGLVEIEPEAEEKANVKLQIQLQVAPKAPAPIPPGKTPEKQSTEQPILPPNLICQQPAPQKPNPPAQPQDGGMQLPLDLSVPMDLPSRSSGKSSTPLALQVGKRPSLPTCYVGPFRMQVLPFSEKQQNDDKIALSVQLAAWPHFGIASVGRVRIDKAIDDQGQRLQHLEEAAGIQEEDQLLKDFRNAIGLPERLDKLPDGRYYEFPLWFQKGSQRSRSLKEVKGSVLATVLSPAEGLVRVTDAFKAIGQRVEGDRGTAVKILEAERDADGQVRLRLELTMPSKIVPAALKKDLNSSVDLPYLQGALSGLSLEDETGRLLPESVKVKVADSGDRTTRELQVIFHPRDGRRPEKLVFSGRYFVTLDIPFTLRDVPLN